MTLGSPRDLARLARRTFLDAVLRGTASLVSACAEGARLLASQTAEPGLYARRRELVLAWPASSAPWAQGLNQSLRAALDVLERGGTPSTRPMGLPATAEGANGAPIFSLVDDAVVELDLMASRLTQAVADKAGWQFTDLCSRLRGLLPEDPNPGEAAGDVLKPAMLSRWVLDAWMAAGLTADHWKTLQNVLHDEVAALAEEAYHEANRLLLEHGVAPEIDLRPFIRRARDVGIVQPMAPSPGVGSRVSGGGLGALGAGSNRVTAMGSAGAVSYDETRLMTQAPGLGRVPQAARSQAVLGKLNQVVARQVPGFDPTQLMGQPDGAVAVATGLSQAMARTEAAVRQQVDVPVGERPEPAALARELI